MKICMRAVLILALAITSLTSLAFTDDWFESMEKSANDYRGSAGTMMAESSGARYEPQYTKEELKTVEATEAKNINEAVRSVSEELKTASIISSNTERIAAADMIREISAMSGPNTASITNIIVENMPEEVPVMYEPVPAPVTMAPSPFHEDAPPAVPLGDGNLPPE